MAQAALHAPDHAELVPFRFKVVRGAARERLAELFCRARARGRQGRSRPGHGARARAARPGHGGARARIDLGHPLVPAHEQWVAVGGRWPSFLHAAHALGFAGEMLSGAKVRDREIAQAFCEPGETLVGWVALGTAQRPPAARSPRRRRPTC
jgi:nitroreductase